MADRVLVAGLGNVFRRDDGFGVYLAARLAAQPEAAGVRIVDFGIRGVHLAYEILDGGYDLVVLLDACPVGGPPGTLAVIEPAAAPSSGAVADGHALDPAAVLRYVSALGGCRSRVLLVGCEPASVDDGMGLTPTVEAVLEPAARMVRDLIGAAAGRAPEENTAHVSGDSGTDRRALG